MVSSQLIFVRCEICQGMGKIKCQSCQSEDSDCQRETDGLKVYSEVEEGNGSDCPLCHGDGFVICPGCCGSGYVDMPALA